MARTVSLATLQGMLARQSGDPILILVRLKHVDLTPNIFVTSDKVDTLSTVSGSSKTYVACPFRIRLPTDLDNEAPRAHLEVDNVDRAIVAAIRSISSPATVNLYLVAASAPNVDIVPMPAFELRNITYDVLAVTGELHLPGMFDSVYPVSKMNPSTFPGVHRS